MLKKIKTAAPPEMIQARRARLQDWIFFGGSDVALFEQEPKSVGAPRCSVDVDGFLSDARQVLKSGQWTNNGPTVRRFESLLSSRLGVRHVIAVCNATVGLQCAIASLCPTLGEVIVPSFTFVATAHAAKWLGHTIRFCDVNPQTLMLDTDHLRLLVNEKTVCIVPVHVYGRTCDMDAIVSVIGKRSIAVVADAAHAFDCRYEDGSYVGTKADCEVFSFHATKCFTSMEGGAIVTNNDKLAARLRTIINFGFVDYDSVASIGTNGKMCEMAALYGVHQLSTIDRLIEHNKANFARYRERFRQQSLDDGEWNKCVALFDATPTCNCHYVVVRWKNDNGSKLTRDLVVQTLTAEKCQLRRYFYPGVHALECYGNCDKLPATESACKEVFCLPTGSAMSINDVDLLCDAIFCLWQQRHQIV